MEDKKDIDIEERAIHSDTKTFIAKIFFYSVILFLLPGEVLLSSTEIGSKIPMAVYAAVFVVITFSAFYFKNKYDDKII